MADEIKNNTHIVPTLVCPFDYPDFTSRARIAKRWLDPERLPRSSRH